jgi:hypothetical protein
MMNMDMNDEYGMQMSLQRWIWNTVMYPEISGSTYDDARKSGRYEDEMDMKDSKWISPPVLWLLQILLH